MQRESDVRDERRQGGPAEAEALPHVNVVIADDIESCLSVPALVVEAAGVYPSLTITVATFRR